MLIDAAHQEETRVAIVNNGQVDDFDFETTGNEQLRGNIYLAKITRVEPSLQAAFVDYGGNRHGFLAFSEIHPDYYQLPQEDREALLREAAEAAAEDDDDDDAVVKEERGNKGAALTTYLSLAGRYSVLMPNTPRGGGISRKIASGTDRKRLKKIVADLDVPQGQGLIVRTAGGKRTKTEIKRDYDYLSKLWETIVEKTLSSEAPKLINEEGSLVHRAMRDMFDKDIEEVLVQGESAYREAKDLAKLIMPSQAKKVQHWKEDDPLFVAEAAQEQLDSIYSPTVQLKSGGYLVINQTEALVAVDVNSGKSTKERNIEQTAVRTNLEAAEEACRQMRLRDLAGLVVIDFIDMDENKNNRAVEKRLKDCLKVDRARVQHGRISQFGLMEISRQRRRQGVLQATSDPCSVCNGTGRNRSIPSAALQLIRAIEARASSGGLKSITVKAPTDVALYLLNNKREELLEIENSAGFAVAIHSSDDLLPGDFTIEAERDPKKKPKKRPKPRSLAKPTKQVDPDLDDDEEEDEDTLARSDEDDEGKPKKRRRRRGGRGRNKRDADGENAKTDLSDDDAEESDDASNDGEQADGDDEDKPKKRRRRGRRGGRRRRKGNGDDAPEDGGAYLDGLATSAPAMLDEVKPEADTKEAEPEAQAEAPADETPAEDKPKRRRRRSPAKAAEAETGDTVDAEAPAEAPAEKPKRRSRAKPKPAEPVEAEAPPEYTPEPAPESVTEPAAAETKDSGTAKKGWWARARGK
ncbi:UNVERIFIED_CONTAM: hypothetical protein GTU68_000031 [Idotea baltica]|nr:hypothetical protein [Idotea baltica]